MAEAADQTTPPAPMAQPLSDDWMLLPKAFAHVTNVLGDPLRAVHEIHRRLLTGEQRSLRRRTLNGAPEDLELAPAFWREFKLVAGLNPGGRDVVRLLDRTDKVPASAVQGAVFYLYRPDVLRLWQCADVHPGAPVSTAPSPPEPSNVEPKTRRARLILVMADLGLPFNLHPAQVEQHTKVQFHARWPDEAKLTIGNRRTTTRAYKEYVASRSSK